MTDSVHRRRRVTFAQVPDSLLIDSRVSDRAVRLWAILDRYAGTNGAAFPLRHTLAERLATSLSSVDRAIAELTAAGWMTVQRRGPRSSSYWLEEEPSSDSSERVVTSDDSRVVTGDDHKESHLNENPAPTELPAAAGVAKSQQPDAPTETQRSKRITDAYAETVPLCRWPAVNGIVLRAMRSGRYADEEIQAALLRLAGEGRSVTVDVLRTELEGLLPPRGSPSRGFDADAARRRAAEREAQEGITE